MRERGKEDGGKIDEIRESERKQAREEINFYHFPFRSSGSSIFVTYYECNSQCFPSLKAHIMNTEALCVLRCVSFFCASLSCHLHLSVSLVTSHCLCLCIGVIYHLNSLSLSFFCFRPSPPSTSHSPLLSRPLFHLSGDGNLIAAIPIKSAVLRTRIALKICLQFEFLLSLCLHLNQISQMAL